MEILNWPIDKELQEETENHYRSRLAKELTDSDPLSIIHRITFDNVAPDIRAEDIKRLFQYIISRFLPSLKGVGLEVGAGPGTFSSILALNRRVEKIYALEVCRPIVELLTPKISSYILGSESKKVTGVIGDFDNLQLSDSSIDFAFDFFSLHHSSDLNKTIKEIKRVLKPNGFIFCLDKARPDYFSQEDLNDLLDTEYDSKSKVELLGVPADQEFTRRMNGEKEYRLKDWHHAFYSAGFQKVEHFHFMKSNGILKRALSILPPRLQSIVTNLMPKPKRSHKFLLDPRNRVFVSEINKFPKEMSLLIAYV